MGLFICCIFGRCSLEEVTSQIRSLFSEKQHLWASFEKFLPTKQQDTSIGIFSTLQEKSQKRNQRSRKHSVKTKQQDPDSSQTSNSASNSLAVSSSDQLPNQQPTNAIIILQETIALLQLLQVYFFNVSNIISST
jgi:histone deacetylase complex regulatory component SIN3